MLKTFYVAVISTLGTFYLLGYFDAEIYQHTRPIVSDSGSRIDVTAADSLITVEEAKRLIRHCRGTVEGYTGATDYLLDKSLNGQVVLRIPWTDSPNTLMGQVMQGKRRYPVFVIYNELPDESGEHYIICGKP